jgi:hypothetical protein
MKTKLIAATVAVLFAAAPLAHAFTYEEDNGPAVDDEDTTGSIVIKKQPTVIIEKQQPTVIIKKRQPDVVIHQNDDDTYDDE